MNAKSDSRASAVAMPLSEAAKRSKMQEDCKNFLWGTWIMLFLTISLGYESFQGFRSGKWVELGKLDSFPVPWWVAAPIALCTAGLSACCMDWHIELKAKVKALGPDAAT